MFFFFNIGYTYEILKVCVYLEKKIGITKALNVIKYIQFS